MRAAQAPLRKKTYIPKMALVGRASWPQPGGSNSQELDSWAGAAGRGFDVWFRHLQSRMGRGCGKELFSHLLNVGNCCRNTPSCH